MMATDRITCWTDGSKESLRQLAYELRCYKIDAQAERRWAVVVPANQIETAREHIARLLDPMRNCGRSTATEKPSSGNPPAHWNFVYVGVPADIKHVVEFCTQQGLEHIAISTGDNDEIAVYADQSRRKITWINLHG